MCSTFGFECPNLGPIKIQWVIASPNLPAKLQPFFPKFIGHSRANLPFKGQGPQGPRRSRRNTGIGACMFFPGSKHDIVKQPGRCLPSKIHLGSSVHTLWLQNNVQKTEPSFGYASQKLKTSFGPNKTIFKGVYSRYQWSRKLVYCLPLNLTMIFPRRH